MYKQAVLATLSYLGFEPKSAKGQKKNSTPTCLNHLDLNQSRVALMESQTGRLAWKAGLAKPALPGRRGLWTCLARPGQVGVALAWPPWLPWPGLARLALPGWRWQALPGWQGQATPSKATLPGRPSWCGRAGLAKPTLPGRLGQAGLAKSATG